MLARRDFSLRVQGNLCWFATISDVGCDEVMCWCADSGVGCATILCWFAVISALRCGGVLCWAARAGSLSVMQIVASSVVQVAAMRLAVGVFEFAALGIIVVLLL